MAGVGYVARGVSPDSLPYQIMNARGLMHGNKETAKGRAMEAKHRRDMSAEHHRTPRRRSGNGR